MFFPTCTVVVVGPTIPAAIVAFASFYDTVSNRPEALVLDALDDYAVRPRPCAGSEALACSANVASRTSRRGISVNRRIVRKLTWV